MGIIPKRYSGNGSIGNTAGLIVAVLLIATVTTVVMKYAGGIAISTLAFLLALFGAKVLVSKRHGSFDFRL